MARLLVSDFSSTCSACGGNALLNDAGAARHDWGGPLLAPGKGCGAVWDETPLYVTKLSTKFSASTLIRMGLSGRYDLLEVR